MSSTFSLNPDARAKLIAEMGTSDPDGAVKPPTAPSLTQGPGFSDDDEASSTDATGNLFIDFDELVGDYGAIPSDYLGLTWNENWYFGNVAYIDSVYGESGYTHHMASAPNIVYNAYAYDLEISAAEDFSFKGANVGAAWNDGLNVRFRGYDDGVMVFEEVVIVDASDTSPDYFEFNFHSIDRLTIESYGGTNAGYSATGTNMVLDNLLFDVEPARVIGRLFEDLNGNGEREGNDPSLAGRTVFSDANGNGELDEGEISAVTNGNGIYSLEGLAPGVHNITQILPDWWVQTSPVVASVDALAAAPYVIDLGIGERVTNVNFGSQDVSASTGGVSGTVYHDWTPNGKQKGAEPGLEGWRVFIDNDGDGEYDQGEHYDFTDANGDYLIAGVEPGTYHVYVDIPEGGWEGWYLTEPAEPLGASLATEEAEVTDFTDLTVAERMELMTALASGPTIAQEDAPDYDLSAAHVEGELIVKLNPLLNSEGLSAINSLQSSMGATTTMATKTLGIEVWKIDGMSLEDALKKLNDNPLVAYAEPNYVHTLAEVENSVDVIPDDTDFSLLYGMHNTGQTGGTADADIDAPEAWDISTGSSNVVVGVIDTGIDYTHPDLDDNIWINPGEIAGNGIDDDSNGYIDDIYGYDFINGDSDPMDDHSHGTHVSGTIGAEGDNAIGVAGVNWDVSLMALKIFNAAGNTTSAAILGAVEYSTMMGADLTNNSWGGGAYSQALYDAIGVADSLGQLFIAAAGNHGGNNDANAYYPATYDHDNIISVAATDDDDLLAYFSGYGATTVDLAAPGVDTYSTTPGGNYGYKSGTSMATPHVTGVAALIKAVAPGISSLGPDGIAEWKAALLDSVDPIAALSGVVASGGRLNAFNAIDGLGGPTPPAAGGREVTITAGSTLPRQDFGIAGGATPFDDTINGTSGDDVIDALAGNDTVNAGDGEDTVNGGDDDDTLNGGDDADILNGGNGEDTLDGGNGDDEMNGDKHNDTLLGSLGADDMDGGEGFDVADYSGSTSAVSVFLDGFGIGGYADGDTLLNIENLIGSDFNDILIGNVGRNSISGLDGDDLILGLGGSDELYGGNNNDTINGGSGKDLIDGGRHHDTLEGEGGADTFLFVDRSGQDTIVDFSSRQGDKIWIDADGASAYGDLTIGDDGSGNALISWTADGNVQSVTLLGIDQADVRPAWFSFGAYVSTAGIPNSVLDLDTADTGSAGLASAGGFAALTATTEEIGRSIYRPLDGEFSKSAMVLSGMPMHAASSYWTEPAPAAEFEHDPWQDTFNPAAWYDDTLYLA